VETDRDLLSLQSHRDTVNSVGLVAGKRLPFTSSNYAVRTFRHALSLDERRVKFKANVWNRPEPDEVDLGTGVPKGNEDEDMKVWALEQKWRPKRVDVPTNIEEVWFAGCHCGKAQPMFPPPF